MAQWIGIHLSMQGRWFNLWSRKIPYATEHAPQLLSLCSRAQEPQQLSPFATATEAHRPVPGKSQNPSAQPTAQKRGQAS